MLSSIFYLTIPIVTLSFLTSRLTVMLSFVILNLFIPIEVCYL